LPAKVESLLQKALTSLTFRGEDFHWRLMEQVWYFISKNQPGLRCSDPLRQAKLCWLATL